MGWWRPSRWWRGGWATRTGARVVARLAGLRSLLGPGPRPEFRAGLREELLRTHAAERAAAAAAAPPTPAAHAPRRRRPSLLVRMRPALVFAALLVTMFGLGVRTHHALPGDVLYPLKRAAESTVLSLAYDDEERAQREMDAARQRAEETASLLTAGSPGRHDLITQTLDDMESTTRAALSRVERRGEASGEARRFAREQHTTVEPLLPKLDRENRDKANQYLSYIDTMTASGR
ncbi:hypothetical protein GCM10009530_09950 [Microbispora corallina]|uniref:DUF5667 domain-containing protein n=1 Tax=Microbispora corallina TaxID=83302 RepID=A0ABQ4FW41_9ACTN|nr:DUF5667 domain-containing protein [Microbispora corallina]GIH38958.1 hypothetical protein Mco01_19580 [Microbispora corallina]